MENLNKNAETEKQVEVQNDLKNKTTGSIVTNAPKVPAKRIRVRAKTKPAPAVLIKSSPAPAAAVEISAPVVEPPKAAKQASKKVKNCCQKSSKKRKS